MLKQLSFRNRRMAKLFVYGTLKRGYSRSTVLQREEFLGTVKTQALYRMYNCGNYPGLVEAPEGLSIEGELWDVSAECLKRLDEIEGVGIKLYRRSKVILKAPHDREPVETYLYLRGTQGMPDCGTRWA